MPWVADDAARRAHEARVAEMVGRRITAVRYFELGGPEPEWPGADFDSLDYGLELDLDDATTWWFSWLQAGPNEGVLATEGRLVGTRLRDDMDFGIYDVTDRSGWPGVVGRPLEAVEAVWIRHEWDPPRDGTHLCVMTWLLRHSTEGVVVITLGGRSPDGSLSPSPDDVSVFFSLAAARRRCVFLPGDEA